MQTISPDNPKIRYTGRVHLAESKLVFFDWPGVQISFAFEGEACRILLSGTAFFDVIIDGRPAFVLKSETRKQELILAQGLENRAHTVIIHKRSESINEVCGFHGLVIEDRAELLPLPPPPERRIEFIGDSHTVGYGNEFPFTECSPEEHDSVFMSSTNTRLAFGPITARMLDAQYHVNAVSGKGLVRNYNWEGRGKEFLYYYGKTLVNPMNDTADSPNWDFSRWIPQVAVINLGINDFQKEPPHADPDLFYERYHGLLDKTRKRYPGVKIICVGSTVTPTRNNLIEKITDIVNAENSAGNQDIWYYEYAPENSALDLHPSLGDHRMIADGLADLISRITGWKRT